MIYLLCLNERASFICRLLSAVATAAASQTLLFRSIIAPFRILWELIGYLVQLKQIVTFFLQRKIFSLSLSKEN